MPIVFKSTFNLLMFLLLIDKARQNEMNDFNRLTTAYSNSLEQLYSGFRFFYTIIYF